MWFFSKNSSSFLQVLSIYKPVASYLLSQKSLSITKSEDPLPDLQKHVSKPSPEPDKSNP